MTREKAEQAAWWSWQEPRPALCMPIRWYLIWLVCAVMGLALVLVLHIWSDQAEPQPPEHIVAYYQTNGAHRVAMHRVLHMFMEWYPHSELQMHNDGGSSKLNSLSALYRIKNYSYKALKGSDTREGMYFKSPEAGADFLERLATAARAAPWLLLLEDDVGVHQHVDTRKLNYDINAHCSSYFDRKLADFVNPLAHGWVCYSGCGGSIIRSSRLLSANRTVDRVAEIMQHIEGDSVASDVLLSAVILLNGGTIGPYTGYTEWAWLPGMVTQHYKVGY